MIRQTHHQFPHARTGDPLALLRIVKRVFGSFTRGVFIKSIIVGIITGLGYFLIGVEVWLPLGVIALVGEIVPIIGPWIAFFISLPVILATQPDKAVLALGLFVVIQLLEGWFLVPHPGRITALHLAGHDHHPGHGRRHCRSDRGHSGAAGRGVAARYLLLHLVPGWGLSPAAALRKLPSFQKEQTRRVPSRDEAARPPP
jgi:hypothetical protein